MYQDLAIILLIFLVWFDDSSLGHFLFGVLYLPFQFSACLGSVLEIQCSINDTGESIQTQTHNAPQWQVSYQYTFCRVMPL
jgi:hypothetical protein